MALLAVALSGGVDSAVAAARMMELGHQLIGVHLILAGNVSPDAQRVAEKLEIPFEVWDFSKDFRSQVCDYFVDEYGQGRTPNPCLRCNQKIKFGQLLDRVLESGYEGLITGHYARLIRQTDLVELHRGLDLAKDQSYVLGVLSQSQLQKAWFPLGASTKEQVRQEAEARQLPVANKSESMDICFIPDGDTTDWLKQQLGVKPGPILDSQGIEIGQHFGVHLYTIGQRRGLNLKIPAANGQPRFVTSLDVSTNTVVVGEREQLAVAGLECISANWCDESCSRDSFSAMVQVRAHSEAIPVEVTNHGQSFSLQLGQTIYGVAPGQQAVIYDKTKVVGSGTISTSS